MQRICSVPSGDGLPSVSLRAMYSRVGETTLAVSGSTIPASVHSTASMPNSSRSSRFAVSSALSFGSMPPLTAFERDAADAVVKLFGEIHVVGVVNRQHANARLHGGNAMRAGFSVGANHIVPAHVEPRIAIDFLRTDNLPRSVLLHICIDRRLISSTCSFSVHKSYSQPSKNKPPVNK